VIWSYSEKTSVPSPTELPKRVVNFNEGVPTNFENTRGRPCLVFLDDLLNDVYSKQVSDLFTKSSLHRNIFHHGRYYRDISVNAKYLVLLKNVRAKNHFIFSTVKFTLKTVLFSTRPIWARLNDPTGIYF